MRLSLYFVLYVILIIDFFVALKFFIMLFERFAYLADYPVIITAEIIVKGIF